MTIVYASKMEEEAIKTAIKEMKGRTKTVKKLRVANLGVSLITEIIKLNENEVEQIQFSLKITNNSKERKKKKILEKPALRYEWREERVANISEN